MSRLKLYFLGTPRLKLDGETVSLSHHKALALLAYLVVTRQRHSRQALAALLWPDYDPTTARGELRRMLWVINKSLGSGWLEVDRETVMLPPQPDLWLDVEQFRDLLAASQQHHPTGEDGQTCIDALAEAIFLAQGDFLSGFSLADSPEFDTWQSFESDSLRRELAGALESLVQLLSQRGEASLEEAITYARRWLALDPLHEPAQRQLMQLYAWAGQPAAAIQQFQVYTQLLWQELGISPAPETTALIEAIKANRLSPPPVDGTHKPAADSRMAPRPGSANIPPHNLPVQATPLIGREATLAALQQHLNAPELRLITILGPGGIGKTRLALALAERQLQPVTAFTDGVYFISLAPISSPETIVQTIAEGLGFPLASAQEPLVQLLTYLRHKRLLLVLDNFEHLLAGVGVVGQILQAAAGVKVVVTSRERLNLSYENLWPISGLNFSQLTDLTTALTDEAVRLFVQRARGVRPDFELQPADLPYLERILQGVWGMPLAIELAAAWLNMLSLAEIAAELGHGLDLLESELRDVPDRHRSMRLVFDHSWERLNNDEQALFKKISIFRGGFAREAAGQITGASLRDLAGLVNKSLLASHPATGRYELHELLRQYAEEKLDAVPAAKLTAQQSHAVYYANLMQRCWADLRSARQLAAVAVIEQDIENIRAAWRCRQAERNSVEMLKFIDSFAMVCDIRGWHQAAVAFFQEAAGQMQPTGADGTMILAHAKALGYEGYFTGIIGNPERGSALSAKAVKLIEPLDQPEALLYALYNRALSALYLNDFYHVIELAQAWRQIGREIGDRWGETVALNFMAVALISQHRLAEAREKIDQALYIFSQEIGEYFGLSWAALVRGRLALGAGAYLEAKLLYDRSLKAAQVLNYRRTIQQSYDNLGDVAFNLGELELAEQYFRLSLEISEETGQIREMLGTLYDVARVRNAQGKKAEAVQLLAVVLNHPLRDLASLLRTERTILSEAAQQLRAGLEIELAPEIFRAAWKRGEGLLLEMAVTKLLR